MKKSSLLLVFLLFTFLFSCSNSIQAPEGLEIVKIDLSEAREGKLSEFFEPEIEYIWLKDDSEDAQLSGGLQKIFFHEGKIFAIDINHCQCVKFFDITGKYFAEINSYGEAPGQYSEFNDVTIVGEEVLLLGVYPPKLMWFSLDGEFLREEKLTKPIDSGVYVKENDRFYFFHDTRDSGDHFVLSVSRPFQDTMKSLPFSKDRYYGNFSSIKLFQKSKESIYFGMSFNDTIYQLDKGLLNPKLVFDYGEYGQSIEELRKNGENLNPLEELNFFVKKSKLSFVPNQRFITESQFYSGFRYQGEPFNVFFDREKQITRVLKGRISDDLDDGYNPNGILYQFDQLKVGNQVPGKDLYEILEKKKQELGHEGFKEYTMAKSRNFAGTAFEAKDSENPVLIIYTVKK
ncbi:6-bladed beta-propeller [Algoriphagus sp.]|uniref:6-bladed beta-propeller n=1 Tax=Algoriphagus sp. TaxID=1872435 RepID=UPI00391B523D